MATFQERLTELIAEKEIKSQELAAIIGVNPTTVNDWKRGKYTVFLANAIKLADFFRCSLDYLIGRSDDSNDFKPCPCPPFYIRFLTVLEKCGISTYRIRNDSGISGGHFNNWKIGRDPLIPTLIPIADYLDVSLDYLVGRED